MKSKLSIVFAHQNFERTYTWEWDEQFALPSSGEVIREITCPVCYKSLKVTVCSKQSLRKGRLIGVYIFAPLSILGFILGIYISWIGYGFGLIFIICFIMNITVIITGKFAPIDYARVCPDGEHKIIKGEILFLETQKQAPQKPSHGDIGQISKKILDFLDNNTLFIGSLDEFRRGQRDFDNWGNGVVNGSKEWVVNKLCMKLSDIGADSLNDMRLTEDYRWQSSKLEGFTVRIEVSIPSGMLTGYYIGRIGDDLFGLFGYGFDQDETEI